MKLPSANLPLSVPDLVRQLTSLWNRLASLLETVDYGTYTPTLTGVANVTTANPQQFQWKRVGNVVTVSGRIDVAATAAGLTQVGASLPIAGNIASSSQVAGSGAMGYSTIAPLLIVGDAANQRALFQFNAPVTSSTAGLLQYTYLIAP